MLEKITSFSAICRWGDRATIIAGSAGQEYVDNIFYNHNNDYELATLNRSGEGEYSFQRAFRIILSFDFNEFLNLSDLRSSANYIDLGDWTIIT